MKIKYLISLTIIFLLIIRCSVHKEQSHPKFVIKKEIDYLLNKNNDVVFLSRIDNLHVYDNWQLSILDKGKIIYIVDSNLVITKMLDFEKDMSHLIKGKIKYHKLNGDNILLIDDEFGCLKIINYHNYDMKKIKIPYDENIINIEKKSFLGRSTSFEIINDSTIILTFSVYSRSDNNSSNNMAALLKLNNPNYIKSIKINSNLIGNPENVYDETFISYNRGLFYITFRISPKILVYDSELRLIKDYTFITDKDFYFLPRKIDENKVQYIIMNCGPICFVDGNSYHTLNRGTEKDFLIVKYDSVFNEIDRYYLKRDALGNDITFMDFSIVKYKNEYILWNWPSPKIVFAKISK